MLNPSVTFVLVPRAACGQNVPESPDDLHWENDKSYPDVQCLAMIAEPFGTSIDLLGDQVPKPKGEQPS